MATMSPVARMTTLSTGVKAIIIGVNITPPPIPARTEIIPMAKLIRKNAKSQSVIVELLISPGAGGWDRNEMIESPMYESTTAVSIIVNSSHGGRRNFDFVILTSTFFYLQFH